MIMEHQSFSNIKKENKSIVRHILVSLVSLLVILLILANYGNIVDLTSGLSYSIFPSKRIAENERLTAELLALYGSSPIEYYGDDGNYNSPAVVIASSNGLAPSNQSSNQSSVSAETLSGDYIYIPSLNVTAPIVAGTVTDAGTILSQLKQGVLMYPGSSVPGGSDSTVIIGHSSSSIPWQKYGRVFSKLPELSNGDLIIVNHNSRKYSYRVTRTMTGSVDQLAGLNIKDDLVLGTCWPIGTDEQRIIVTATLVAST